MTVTKDHLIDSILKIIGNKKKATQVLETLLKTAKQSLENGEDVLISGFGKFCIKERIKGEGGILVLAKI